MTAILQLLEGPPEQRDCAYHLFLYRCGEFPSILRPLRTVDDPAAVASFLEQVVTRDIAGDAPILVADALIASGIFIEFVNEPAGTRTPPARCAAAFLAEGVGARAQRHSRGAHSPEVPAA